MGFSAWGVHNPDPLRAQVCPPQALKPMATYGYGRLPIFPVQKYLLVLTICMEIIMLNRG